MAPARKPTLLIADDHVLLAESMANLLAPEYTVLGLVGNGRQLVIDAVRLQPDLILLDISMPELNGLEAARQLQSSAPRSRMIFVTQQVDTNYLRAALRVGALGFVAKQSAVSELRSALQSALRGKVFITPLIRDTLGFVPLSSMRVDALQDKNLLTPRQREVLQLVAEGKTTHEIAATLQISSKTVEFHKKALMDQTGLRTTAELTRFALRHGITG